MSTTTLLTLSNALFAPSRERLVASGRAHGISSIRAYDFDLLRTQDPFFAVHRTTFDQPRGLGYWLWKPYLIQQTLAGLEPGDVVVYMDSGIEIVADLAPLVSLCRASGSMLLFGNAADTNARWTRRDCFVRTGCDRPEYWHGPHCDASIVLACKGTASSAFVDEWLAACADPAALGDGPNVGGLPDLPEFQDHRHDQSVLSLMAQKHRISLHRAPSQFGNHYKAYEWRVPGEFNCANQWDQTPVEFYAAVPYHNSHYAQLVNHHRTRVQPPEATPVEEAPPTWVQRVRRRLSSWRAGMRGQ